jgi:hypothetical protein
MAGPLPSPARTAHNGGVRALVAVLVGLVLLAAGACPRAAVASTSQAQPGYSAADDHSAGVAAFELEKGAAPGLGGAPFFSLLCHPGRPGALCPVPGRAPGATRDRSPPVH